MRCNAYTWSIGTRTLRWLGAAAAIAVAAGAPIALAAPVEPRVGGLIAPAAVTPGPNRLRDPGFETGASPWSGAPGWVVDRRVAHAGAASYRRDAGAPTATTTVELSPGVYRFSAWVKTEALGDGARLRLDFRPGAQRWFTAEIEPGTADWRRYELTDVVVGEPARVTLKLETDERTAGTAWFDDVTLEEQLTPLQTFLLYPNFRGLMFDDGPSALSVDVQVALPARDLPRHSIRGVLRDEATGRVVAERSYPARAAFVAELDGRGMRPGAAYRATFALVDDATGTRVSASPAYRVWRAAASTRDSMRVSVDRANRVLVHGVPRFLLGGDDPRIARGAAVDGLAVTVVDACAPTAEAAFARYDEARRRDVTAVTMAVAGPAELARWRDGADIVATEPQPMFGPEPSGGYDHRAVAEATAAARAAVREARAVVSVLPFAPLSSLGRWPTRAELRSHAYMAIVEGARGLWWSSVGEGRCGAACADDAAHMDDLLSVVHELGALERVLLVADTPAALAGNSNSNIKAKVKLVNGKGFVLAYNASGSRQPATFTWTTAPGAVTVHGEDRALVVSGHSFSDTFEPFAAHVYVVADAGRGGR